MNFSERRSLIHLILDSQLISQRHPVLHHVTTISFPLARNLWPSRNSRNPC
jgi:hypothetical protein